jgi:hypothetical protein
MCDRSQLAALLPYLTTKLGSLMVLQILNMADLIKAAPQIRISKMSEFSRYSLIKLGQKYMLECCLMSFTKRKKDRLPCMIV